MKLKIVRLTRTALCPTRQYRQAAGFDIYADEQKIIKRQSSAMVSTGIKVELPPGTYGLLKERSSMALQDLTVTGGIIDNDFRGEIMIILRNNGDRDAIIPWGSRIGQLLVNSTPPELQVELVQELSSTERGQRGLGSSGTEVEWI